MWTNCCSALFENQSVGVAEVNLQPLGAADQASAQSMAFASCSQPCYWLMMLSDQSGNWTELLRLSSAAALL